MSVDYLSFSPSLLSILSHIDVKDILNCQLVCRRIRDVINRNPYRMPRLEAKMDLSVNYSQDGSLKSASVSYVAMELLKQDSFNIWEGMTEITQWGHLEPIRDHYKNNGLEVKDRYIRMADWWVYGVAISSVAESLRLLFQFILPRNHFSSIRIIEKTPGSTTFAIDMYRMLSDQMREYKTKCDCIQPNICARPDTYSFFNKIDCQYILMVAKTIGQVLENIPSCDRPTGILVSPETFKCFSPIFDFLKKWQLGLCGRVKNVRVCQEEARGAFRWTNSDVIGFLRCKQCIGVKEKKNDPWAEIYLQRETDARVIGVRYSQVQGTLIMEEVQEYTGLDDQLRIEYKDTEYKYFPQNEPLDFGGEID